MAFLSDRKMKICHANMITGSVQLKRSDEGDSVVDFGISETGFWVVLMRHAAFSRMILAGSRDQREPLNDWKSAEFQ